MDRSSRLSSPIPFPRLLAFPLALACLAPPVARAGPELDSAIVFVSRDTAARPDPSARKRPIELAASGKLLVREADGALRVLVDAQADVPSGSAPVDVIDPEVSYDGERIVFAGFVESEDAWRIWEIHADGSGLRQVTRSDRAIDLSRYGAAAALFASYDDVDPCYLPDGRICFVSTRYPQAAPDGRVRATNLHVVEADGSDLHRITTERFGADTPVVEPDTGRLIYSRWWRSAQITAAANGEAPEPIPPGSPGYGGLEFDESDLAVRAIREHDFPGVNSWFLGHINPDGTDMAMHSGFRLDRELTQAHRPSPTADGGMLALFIPQTPFLGVPGADGLRLFETGAGVPEPLGGPQSFSRIGADGDVIDPDPTGLVFAGAVELSGGRILVSAATFGTRDYGIFIKENLGAEPVLVHDAPGTAELDAVPLASRPVPPVIEDRVSDRAADLAPRTVAEAKEMGGSFRFQAENIFFNGPVDMAIANAPPVGRRLTIEFYMNPQRTSPTASDAPILIDAVEIPPEGKVEVELPGGVPLFELLRNRDGTLPLGRDGQIFHVGGFNFGRAGEDAKCVGCHAGHSMLDVPADPSWTNVAPSATVRATSVRSQSDPAINQKVEFKPVRLVDRRTDRVDSEWAAESPSAELRLAWSTALLGRQVVLHAPEPGGGRFGERSQVVQAATVETFFHGDKVQELRVEGPISAAGTSVDLDPEVEFTGLTVTIDRADVSGYYEGRTGVALAEIEVIARATGEPGASFVRGDANCDGRINIADAASLLNFLFLGGPKSCCDEATDFNDDARVNISDPIFSLNFLFLGGPRLAPPFPNCGPSTRGLGCDGATPCP